MPIQFTNPSCAVVIATCDEGADLEATLALIATGKTVPDEVIVVDDGSREPLEPRLDWARKFLPLTVLRNDRRTGSGRAKSQGLDHAKSDLLVVMDSHIRLPWAWLDWTKESFCQWPYSLMCPWSYGFRDRPPGSRVLNWHHAPTFADFGARFLLHEHGAWDIIWTKSRGRDGTQRPEPKHGDVIGCILGGCYIFGRELMHYLGGYNRHHVNWGYEQEGFSLRAWSAGFDCRIVDFPARHHYGTKDDGGRQEWTKAKDAPNQAWGSWANRHFSAATLWSDDSLYRDVYGPMMRKHYWPGPLDEWWKQAEPLVSAERARIKTLRRRSDDEMAQMLLGFPHPQNIVEYQALERIYGRPPKKAKA